MEFVEKDSKGNLRVEISQVLNVLTNADMELHHDKAYDTLLLLDGSYSESLPALIDIAEDQNAESFARCFAVSAILKIAPISHEILPLLIKLVRDTDQTIRKEVIIALRGCKYQECSEVLPSLVASIRDIHNSADIQYASFATLVKLTSFTTAISYLTGRKSV